MKAIETFNTQSEEYLDLLARYENGEVDYNVVADAYIQLQAAHQAAVVEWQAEYDAAVVQHDGDQAAYDAAVAQYESDMAAYDAAVAAFNAELAAYNGEVAAHEAALAAWETYQQGIADGTIEAFSCQITPNAPVSSSNINGNTPGYKIADGIVLSGGGNSPFKVTVEEGAMQGVFTITLKNGNQYTNYEFTVSGAGQHNLTIVNQSNSSGFGIGQYVSNDVPVFSKAPPANPGEFSSEGPGDPPPPVPGPGACPELNMVLPEAREGDDDDDDDDDGDDDGDADGDDDGNADDDDDDSDDDDDADDDDDDDDSDDDDDDDDDGDDDDSDDDDDDDDADDDDDDDDADDDDDDDD